MPKNPTQIGQFLGSAFLIISEFESQKFLQLIKIPVFRFLKHFLYFEPQIFFKFCTIKLLGQKYLDFGEKLNHFVSNAARINSPYFSLIYFKFLVSTCILSLSIFLRFSKVLEARFRFFTQE